MYKAKILESQRSLFAIMIGATLSIFLSILFLAPAQATSHVSVTASPSPADFTVQRPNKTAGVVEIENNSEQPITVKGAKAGSSCNSKANAAEYSWFTPSFIGEIAADSSKTVDFELDARYLMPGEYSVLFCLENRYDTNPDIPQGHLATIPITFTVEDGEGPEVSSIKTWQESYSMGDDEKMRVPATALFDDGNDMSIGRFAEWESADESIATVHYGWVTAVAPGETELTVTYGGKTATIPLVVSGEAPQLSVQPGSIEATAGQGTLTDIDMTLENTGGAQLDWNIAFAKDGQDCSDTSTPVKPWLTITGEDEVGSLAPGASIKTGFSALAYNFHDETELLALGDHHGAACIISNDPEQPVVTVPIALTVEEAPQLDVFSPDWQFYTLPGGGHHVYRIGDGDNMIEIANNGGSQLRWSIFVARESCNQPAHDSWLTLEKNAGEVAPGEVDYVFFNPHGAREESFELGDHDMVFCISSNDHQQQAATVPLRLSVVEPQDMPIDYLELQIPAASEFEAGTTAQLTAMKHVFSGHIFEVSSEAVWISSDETIATVDASGQITAVSPGEATITVEHEGKTDTLRITVVEAEESEQSEEPSSPWQAVKDWLQTLISALEDLLARLQP